jgi:hypothetical protein
MLIHDANDGKVRAAIGVCIKENTWQLPDRGLLCHTREQDVGQTAWGGLRLVVYSRYGFAK